MRTAPVLVVFDLDACCWFPEMYMLWGGGAPFRVVHKTNTLLDARGTSVRLLADALTKNDARAEVLRLRA